MTACLDYVKQAWVHYLSIEGPNNPPQKGFNAVTMSTLEIVDAKPGYVEATMKIIKGQINRGGAIHGGMLCSLVDTVGSLALVSQGLKYSGPSTDIHTTFIRSAGKEGDTIRLEGRVLNSGRTLAFTEVRVLHPESGKLLATGLHTKLVAKAIDHPENVKFDETGSTILSK